MPKEEKTFNDEVKELEEFLETASQDDFKNFPVSTFILPISCSTRPALRVLLLPTRIRIARIIAMSVLHFGPPLLLFVTNESYSRLINFDRYPLAVIFVFSIVEMTLLNFESMRRAEVLIVLFINPKFETSKLSSLDCYVAALAASSYLQIVVFFELFLLIPTFQKIEELFCY